MPVMAYLDKREIDALLAVPDRQRPQGRRDYALLLFLYNTGARASEAPMLNLGDLDRARCAIHGQPAREGARNAPLPFVEPYRIRLSSRWSYPQGD